jgi:RND superfamily putative drug exporter
VTAAAVIMICVFAAFVPHSDMAVKPIALGLAVGVFVDAFLVRMTLVPAVLALLGDRAWWLPRRLDAALPALDVEGSGVEHHLEHADWVDRHGPAPVRAERLTLTEAGVAVYADVDLVVRPGQLVAACTEDRVARRALLTTLGGRLPATSGRLVVVDQVLPEEAAAVRRSVPVHDRFPTAEQLAALERRAADGDVPLLVVDDVDHFASEDEVQARWDRLAGIAALGTAVVAGCRGGAPREATVLHLDPHVSTEEISL